MHERDQSVWIRRLRHFGTRERRQLPICQTTLCHICVISLNHISCQKQIDRKWVILPGGSICLKLHSKIKTFFNSPPTPLPIMRLHHNNNLNYFLCLSSSPAAACWVSLPCFSLLLLHMAWTYFTRHSKWLYYGRNRRQVPNCQTTLSYVGSLNHISCQKAIDRQWHGLYE